MSNLKDVLIKLDLEGKDGLYYMIQNNWEKKLSLPNRIKSILKEKIKPTAFFCLDNKPIILFFENPNDIENLHKSIWNFNESPIIFLIKNNKIEIFNGFEYIRNAKQLKQIDGENILNDFTYFELVTGNTFEKYRQQFKATNNRVDEKLLQNINDAHKKIEGQNANIDRRIINALIGKLIFIRYLIDRKIKIKFDGRSRLWTNEDVCELLDKPEKIKSFFQYLENRETGFNGDLFPLKENDYTKIKKEDYKILKNLLKGVEISTGQLSLFQDYDFSIIPIEFISNVYETFLGDNQRENSAYYTPLFLVDYILKETVEKEVEKKINKTHNYNCVVLDPACGSGIFLVETLRKIIEKFIEKENPIKTDKTFKESIKKLVLNNIFGIDKDENAIQVAIFSTYLTMLDYFEPATIEDAFKFPNLLGTNFFKADFFDEDANFNTILKEKKIDCIVGNPPWSRGRNETSPLYYTYIENRKIRETRQPIKCEIGNKEIAQAFLIRSSDFCKPTTRCSLIVTSKVLYNTNSIKFRKYFLENFTIEQVFELAPVRTEVFTNAAGPACILSYKFANKKNTDLNIINHIVLKPSYFFKLFKIFILYKNDIKEVQQNRLKEYDWLWKVLVYGSYLDFNFIKRLKEEYNSIEKKLTNNKEFFIGTGIQFSNNPLLDSTHLNDKLFIEVEAIEPFFINKKFMKIFHKSKVHRLRNSQIFEPPMLLMKKSIDPVTLTIKCAISNQELLFKNSLTSIAIRDKKNINVLYNLIAIFTSNLLSYFSINTFASIGIERYQSQNSDYFGLPYLQLNVSTQIKNIEKNTSELNNSRNTNIIESNNNIQQLENCIIAELENINKKIFEKLVLNDIEISLINYALDINLKLINKTKNNIFDPIKINESILKNYAQIFLDRFSENFNDNKHRFIVEIWHTKQIIGMLFKIIPTAKFEEKIIEKKDQNNAEIIKFLVSISVEKITENLFIQKDIRGFEENYFYIFKPNEKHLWHKAIGYLDVQEFADVMIKNQKI